MAAAAGIGMGMQLAGTAGQMMANVRSAESQARGAEYQARGLDYEAAGIQQQAAFDARQEARRQRILQGEANAMAAASGLDITRGSPLLLELDRVRQGALEVASIRRSGLAQATTRRMGAGLARMEAGFARGSIPYSILGGAMQSGSILTNYAMRKS